MDALRKIVVGLATMSESQLLQMRRTVQDISGHNSAKELVLNLIDLYLRVGDDPERRAKAAVACLLALDEVEKSHGGGRPTISASSSSGSGGCSSVFLVLLAIAAGVYFCL